MASIGERLSAAGTANALELRGVSRMFGALAALSDVTMSVRPGERPAKDGPFGAKGIGEMAATPPIPAIANAIFDAVGVRIDEMPFTPEKILRALRARGGAAAAG